MIRESILVSVLSFLVSIVTFINQLLLASVFGAGKLMDIYLSGSAVPVLISGLITASLSYSLTPHLIKIRVSSEDNEYGYYVTRMFVRLVLYSGLLCIVGMAIVSFSIIAILPVGSEHFATSIWINILSWLSTFFFILLAFNTCYFNAVRKFKFPLFLNFLPYLGSIVTCTLFYQSISILAIPIGLLSGTVVAFTISFFLMNYNFRIDNINVSFNQSIQSYFSRIPLICIAMLCFSVYQSIDAYWAPRIGTAGLSYLGYCQRILVAIGTVVILGPSTVLIPRLTEAIAENRKNDFMNDTTIIIKLVIALSSLIAVIGSVLSEDIIRIMFERGAFKPIDTMRIAAVLPYMLTGMIFMLCGVILFRILFVKEMINIVAGLGITSTVVYFIFSGFGAVYIGLQGIGSAYILTWLIILMFALYNIFKQDLKFFFCKQTLFFFSKQIILLTIVGVTVMLLSMLLRGSVLTFWNSFTVVAVCGTTGVLVYTLLSLTIIRQKEIGLLAFPIINNIKRWVYQQ